MVNVLLNGTMWTKYVHKSCRSYEFPEIIVAV